MATQYSVRESAAPAIVGEIPDDIIAIVAKNRAKSDQIHRRYYSYQLSQKFPGETMISCYNSHDYGKVQLRDGNNTGAAFPRHIYHWKTTVVSIQEIS